MQFKPTALFMETERGANVRIAKDVSIAAVFTVAFLVTGCAHGAHPFVQVQFCLKENERPLLMDLLRDVARREHMDFLDGSAELDAVAKRQREVTGIEIARLSPNISVSQTRKDGLSASVRNVGLPDQIFIGFSAPKELDSARGWAQSVVTRLEEHWMVVTVPDDEGATPLDCQRR